MTLPTAVAPGWPHTLLPRGRPLDRRTWGRRHAALSLVLLAHVPLLVGVTIATGVHALAVGPAVVALAGSSALPRRRERELLLSAGLMWSSAVLVVASGGAVLAHLDVVLALVAVSLYEDRAPVLVAAAAGILWYGVGGLLAPEAVFGSAGADAAGLLVPLAVLLVVAVSLASCAWWRGTEASTRLAERERALAQQLASVEAVKDRLVAIVSHEFRTPLASITGLARTLAARNDDLDRETVRACLAGIDHHARRLTRLVHNVVAASGDIDVNQTVTTDLSDITRAAIAEALEAHRHRTDVRLDVPAPLMAGVSPLAARRILDNLCDNAVKFAPAGALVEVSGMHEDDAVILEIANETEAICPRTLERCFEPFVQADSSDTRPGEGMGLGLHVARRLARAHGGDLCARLRERHVVFRLRLPPPGPLTTAVLKDASALAGGVPERPRQRAVGVGSDGSHRRS